MPKKNQQRDKNCKKNQIKILEPKSTVADIKNLLQGFNNRLKLEEGKKMSELVDRSIEIIV